MNRSLSTASEGVRAIYTQPNTILPQWLRKLEIASGEEDTTGIVKVGENGLMVDPHALADFLAEVDKVESGGKAELLRSLTSGGLGVAGEVLAVRRTLEMALKDGEIPEQELLNFTTSGYGLRFPIGWTTVPNCPTPGGASWAPRDSESISLFQTCKRMPILPAVVHGIRNAGSYVGSIPCDQNAPVPTPLSTPLSKDLSVALGDYLAVEAKTPNKGPDFSVRLGGGHWSGETLVNRSQLQKWLVNFMPKAQDAELQASS